MYIIETFVEDLYQYLTGNNRRGRCHIIRKHSKRLNQLGDISFPLNIKNWTQVIDNTKENCSIFDYLLPDLDLNSQIGALIIQSHRWSLKIEKYKIINNCDVHLYLIRPQAIDLCLKEALKVLGNYGTEPKYFKKNITLESDFTLANDTSQMNLTELRMAIVQSVASNVINILSQCSDSEECKVRITQKSNEMQNMELLCGPVLNENGVKDTRTTAADLIKKRASDMQLMAQHKYGVQVKPSSSWIDYFNKLGNSCVVIELLQNKAHKPIRIGLNNLQTANKGPSFIFYNCARLSSLFKEFEKRILNGVYPTLPSIEDIDFTLLDQIEEWEMVFVYIMQFPEVIRTSVCDITSGIANLHYLITFLANLSSIFSVYYRRIKVLTISKNHLLPLLYARIYLLKVVQQLFHMVLGFLNLEPIKEM